MKNFTFIPLLALLITACQTTTINESRQIEVVLSGRTLYF